MINGLFEVGIILKHGETKWCSIEFIHDGDKDKNNKNK